MRALLAAELLKLRTTRTFVAIATVAIAISVLVAALTSLLSEPTESSVLADLFTDDTSGLFIAILGIVGISGEWRHRTITSSLLAAPDRLRFLAAKTVAFATAGLILSLLVSIAVAVVGFIILSSRDLPVPEGGELAAQVGRNAISAALLGALGVGIGGVVRNQPIAIVGVLLLSLVFEPILLALVPEAGQFGPFLALPVGIQDVSSDGAGFAGGEILAPGLAGLAMLAWIGVAFAASYALLRGRDVA